MTEEKMTLDKFIVYRVTVYKLTLDKFAVGDMTVDN